MPECKNLGKFLQTNSIKQLSATCGFTCTCKLYVKRVTTPIEQYLLFIIYKQTKCDRENGLQHQTH